MRSTVVPTERETESKDVVILTHQGWGTGHIEKAFNQSSLARNYKIITSFRSVRSTAKEVGDKVKVLICHLNVPEGGEGADVVRAVREARQQQVFTVLFVSGGGVPRRFDGVAHARAHMQARERDFSPLVDLAEEGLAWHKDKRWERIHPQRSKK